MNLSFRINSKPEEANTRTTVPWACKLSLVKFKKSKATPVTGRRGP
jgi:hypothetical protein